MTPKNVNINAINYFKNLKGSFSTRNNNTIDKNILNKNNNYTLKKDKTVKSYFVFNPKNNYCDDIVAVIDNGKIR